MWRLLLLLLLCGAAVAASPPLVFTFTSGRSGTQSLSSLARQCCAARDPPCVASHEASREVLGNAMLLRNVVGWGPEGRSTAVDQAVAASLSHPEPYIEVSGLFPYYARETLAAAVAQGRPVTVLVLRRDLAATLASWMGAWGDRKTWDAIGRRYLHTPHAPGSPTSPLRPLHESEPSELVASYLIDLQARLLQLKQEFPPETGVRFVEARTEDLLQPGHSAFRAFMADVGLPCPESLALVHEVTDMTSFRRAGEDKPRARAAARVLLSAYVAEAERQGKWLPPMPHHAPATDEDVALVGCAVSDYACVVAAVEPFLRRSVERDEALQVVSPLDGQAVGEEGVTLSVQGSWLPDKGPEPGYVRYLGVYTLMEAPNGDVKEFLLDALDWYAHMVTKATLMPLAFVRPFPGPAPTTVTLQIQARDCPAWHAVEYSLALHQTTGVTQENVHAVKATADRDLHLARMGEREDYMDPLAFQRMFGHWPVLQGCSVIQGPGAQLQLVGTSSLQPDIWHPVHATRM